MTKEQKIVLITIIIVGTGILGFLLYRNQEDTSTSLDSSTELTPSDSSIDNSILPSDPIQDDMMMRRGIPPMNPEQEMLEERVRMGEELTPEETQRLEEYRMMSEAEFGPDARFRRNPADPRFESELSEPVADPLIEPTPEN